MPILPDHSREITTLLEKVHAHLKDVEADPAQPLNEELLNQVRIFITSRSTQKPASSSYANFSDSIYPPATPVKDILNQLSRLLPTLQQDPAPVTELTTSLISLPGFTFRDALNIDPPVQFTLALKSDVPAISLMILEILGKVSKSQVDINWVAGKRDIVQSLIQLWLRASDTGVSQVAGKVFSKLLNGPKEEKPTGHVDATLDQNLMWRRVFRDRDVYRTFYEECTLSNVGQDGQLSRGRKTIAQGRLQDWLLDVSVDVVRTTQISDVEKQYGVGDGGLLEFAAARMVDYEEDDLMRSTLIHFCTNLVEQGRSEELDSMNDLAFLKKYGMHHTCMSYFLDLNGGHSSWTLENSASYIATYTKSYQKDFLRNPALSTSIVELILQQLANSHTLRNDHSIVLAALPRFLLLRNGGESVLNRLPSHKSYPQTVKMLAKVFGHSDHVDDRIAARALYYLYAKVHPDLWEDIVQLASTAALFEGAVAANQLIGNVISAEWERLPETFQKSQLFAGLTEEGLARKCNNGRSLPQHSTEVILSAPALQTVVPYLMQRPQEADKKRYQNMSSEHREVTEELGKVRHIALRMLLIQVKGMPRSEDVDKITQAMERRWEEGPMGYGADSGGEATFYGALGGL
ncbi:uncharacterized protein KY384_000429 [Bacidia gigantensis]|uniref:uncharacterized protein n=1 Tax=Bacidia gigantensis TaxID=2732470 RepID=UPI001D05468E|nr:uncharacterized protein KY384_000429 [Bacidia gigantensis]KAG8525669.1 hypothetical protein KY384_000429 [Bacidia gigantensis]